jgi:hypothetical protein
MGGSEGTAIKRGSPPVHSDAMLDSPTPADGGQGGAGGTTVSAMGGAAGTTMVAMGGAGGSMEDPPDAMPPAPDVMEPDPKPSCDEVASVLIEVPGCSLYSDARGVEANVIHDSCGLGGCHNQAVFGPSLRYDTNTFRRLVDVKGSRTCTDDYLIDRDAPLESLFLRALQPKGTVCGNSDETINFTHFTERPLSVAEQECIEAYVVAVANACI